MPGARSDPKPLPLVSRYFQVPSSNRYATRKPRQALVALGHRIALALVAHRRLALLPFFVFRST